MKNIKFEITESDIKDYLKRHKEDENIKYREAMFVKYIKEQEKLTSEAMEILMWKYNDAVIKPTGIYTEIPRCNHTYKIFHELPDFNDYLKKIKNLDISGICHIMIPTIRLYKKYSGSYKSVIFINDLANISKQLGLEIKKNVEFIKNLKEALYNYKVSEKVSEYYFDPDIDGAYYSIGIRKDHCNRELEKYQLIYGEEPVKVIKKTMSERV